MILNEIKMKQLHNLKKMKLKGTRAALKEKI